MKRQVTPLEEMTCSACGKSKPVKEFPRNVGRRGRICNHCKCKRVKQSKRKRARRVEGLPWWIERAQ